ncbi:hypothetical protein HPB47_017886 [Ixodes persulcatus]|uniref:Uncharacterized protein n=1 Tax=Ixodes persulcatus TaxID=34615 RepID=A0AC60QN43_IXOPE|nr:hypothetical protein HPB47_017886 [Ixodes persulcatus]
MTAFVQKSNPHEQNVKTAEIKMSAFVAEHALSFKAMDHLGELAKVVFHDSAIAKGSLASAVEKCLSEKKVPLTNIIALACDNASVMVGERNSLMTRLREKADDSFITIRCICHSLHIAASKAALKLPRNVEDLLRNELYVGAGCQGILDKITMEGGSSEVRDFKLRCMSFYQTAVLEVQKRLPISGPFFHEVRFVQPSTALSYEARKRLPSLPVLQDRYKHLLPSKQAWAGECQRPALGQVSHGYPGRDVCQLDCERRTYEAL